MFQVTFDLLPANAFVLGKPKILSSGKGLNNFPMNMAANSPRQAVLGILGVLNVLTLTYVRYWSLAIK